MHRRDTVIEKNFIKELTRFQRELEHEKKAYSKILGILNMLEEV
jgi:hypothetical protein